MVFHKLICVNCPVAIKNPNSFQSRINHIGDFIMFAQLYRGYHQLLSSFENKGLGEVIIRLKCAMIMNLHNFKNL